MNDQSMQVLPRQVKDICGMRFGRLTVAEYAGVTESKRAQWLCTCDCGDEVVVYGGDLRSGHTQSCGCLQREKIREVCAIMVNGSPITEHPLYGTWFKMISRCTNLSDSAYERYGARGIHVCHRWQLPNGEGLSNFAHDMGPKPSPNHSIERVDNADGYGPGNCTWALMGVQSRNKRNNVWVIYENTRMILTDLAALLGIKRVTLSTRFRTLKAMNKIPRTYSGDYVAISELTAKVA